MLGICEVCALPGSVRAALHAYAWHMRSICHGALLTACGPHQPPQVDPHCLSPNQHVLLAKEWLNLPVALDGDEVYNLEFLPPALAIAALYFHPLNFPTMHRRAEATVRGGAAPAAHAEEEEESEQEEILEEGGSNTVAGRAAAAAARPAPAAPPGGPAVRPDAEGVREYAHPFTCDACLAGQAQMEARLRQYAREHGVEEEGVIQLFVALAMGKDKTDVERMRSVDALHLKLLNTALAIWHKRHSKLWIASFPILVRDEDGSDKENARARQRLYQRSMALWMVLLEACARLGIKVTHRYAAPTL